MEAKIENMQEMFTKDLLLLLSYFSRVRLCATPETEAHQAPPSLGFSGKNTGVGCHFLLQCMQVKSESEVAQSCLTFSDPMDCSLPGSSVHGSFQARVLEWGPRSTKEQTNRDEQYSRRNNSRITEAEKWISDLEDRKVEINTAKQNIEKRMKRNEDSLTDLQDNIKHTNIHSTGVQEGEERERKDPRKYLKR